MWAASLSLSGCGAGAGPLARGRVEVVPPGADAVRLVYLGVGGWILERGDDQILTAPLFSNPSFVRAGPGRIASDPAAVDRGMSGHDVSRASAILVGHAHYDHLMDVPRVSHHGPHFDRIALFQGTADRPRREAPELGSDWVDGPSWCPPPSTRWSGTQRQW